MYYLIDAQVPMPTDWISAVAALIGVVFAFITLLKLVAKDEDKQKQLNSLRDIAQTQRNINENLQAQISQLIKQTIEFQEQSRLMFEANNILQKNLNREEAKMELARRDRILEKMPNFVRNNQEAYGNSSEVKIKLINKGDVASNLLIENLTIEDLLFSSIDPKVIVEANKDFEIRGNVIHSKFLPNLSDMTFTLKLSFNDMDNNRYFQTIKWENSTYIIESPISFQAS